MTAEVHAFARTGAAARAPLVPAHVDVHTADGCHFDLPDLRDSDWVRTLDLAHRGAVAVLHMESMRGKPSGSLPNDDGLLASYLGFSIREVDQFLAMKAKVLHGWILCSDGRLYHPLRARSILRLWIGWRETNRRSALGNGARNVEVRRGIREIEADIDEAAEALRLLDPKDKFLDELEARMSKWTTRQLPKEVATGVTEAVTSGDPTVTEAVTPLHPSLDGSHKLSEAKRSKADSSSPLCGDDSPDSEIVTRRDIVENRGSVKRTPGRPTPSERAPPWPDGWFTAFKARYPRKEAWGRAEKVLERIRKAGRVPFEEILAGVDRYVARGLTPEYTRLPATWLNDRGWEDDPDPTPGGGGRPADRTPGFRGPMKSSERPSSSRAPAPTRASLATEVLESLYDRTR